MNFLLKTTGFVPEMLNVDSWAGRLVSVEMEQVIGGLFLFLKSWILHY